MSVYKIHLKSVTPYTQSKFVNVPKLDKERPDDYEARTWRERLHVNEDGFVFIPPTALKNCISEAAKYLSMQIPGKGKATFTKHFEAGLLIVDPIVLPVKKEDVQGDWLHLNADGKRGGSTRVMRCMPKIPSWEGDMVVHVLDETITKDVLIHHIQEAGKLIGIGQFRPRNNGFHGRFVVVGMEEI